MLRKMCVRILVLRIHINMKKLTPARGNWIIYNILLKGIYLYLNTLNNDVYNNTINYDGSTVIHDFEA